MVDNFADLHLSDLRINETYTSEGKENFICLFGQWIKRIENAFSLKIRMIPQIAAW